MKCMGLSKRMQKTMPIMTSALDKMQRPGSEVHEDTVPYSLLMKQNCMEDGGENRVRDKVFFFFIRMSRIERARAAVPFDRSLLRVLREH